MTWRVVLVFFFTCLRRGVTGDVDRSTALDINPQRKLEESSSDGERNTWQRYCSSPDTIKANRVIPPLSQEVKDTNPELLQVLVFTRHGARTPASMYEGCWEGYTPTWDCELPVEAIAALTSDHTPPLTTNDKSVIRDNTADVKQNSPKDLRELDDDTMSPPPPSMVFPKLYKVTTGKNVFGGSCQKGQLVAEGAKQHHILGQVLAEAYFPGNVTSIGDSVWGKPLIPPEDWTDLSAVMHFRSTDMQRTRLSGSILLSSLIRSAFGSSLRSDTVKAPPLHTMDAETEYLYFRSDVKSMADAVNSLDYAALRQSHDSLRLRLHNKLRFSDGPEGVWPEHLLDCLMTTACHESRFQSELPKFLVDEPKVLQETYEATCKEVLFPFTWNNSRLSKENSKSLVKEIRQAICGDCETKAILTVNDHMADNTQRPHGGGQDSSMLSTSVGKRFMLWSGHDKTIMALLSSIEAFDNIWTPYAALLSIEIYKTADRQVGFRMVYNSEEITYRVAGCEAKQFCPLVRFLEASNWVNDDAIELQPLSKTSKSPWLSAASIINLCSSDPLRGSSISQGGVVVLSILIGVAIGAFCAYRIIKHRVRITDGGGSGSKAVKVQLTRRLS